MKGKHGNTSMIMKYSLGVLLKTIEASKSSTFS